MKNPVLVLRILALIEGASFLVLLGIGMPLKYIWEMPIAVKVTGWIHGILFILLLAALVRASRAARWPAGRSALVLIAALLPFGPFAIDRRMIQYQREHEIQ